MAACHCLLCMMSGVRKIEIQPAHSGRTAVNIYVRIVFWIKRGSARAFYGSTQPGHGKPQFE